VEVKVEHSSFVLLALHISLSTPITDITLNNSKQMNMFSEYSPRKLDLKNHPTVYAYGWVPCFQ
jgi:hypothetical protein